MVLFADMDAQGWALLVAAVFVGVGGLLTPICAFGVLVLAFLERNRAAQRAHEIAVKVEEVKAALATHGQKQEAKDQRQEAKMDEIHKATNGLVKKLEDAAFDRGAKSEHDKPR